MVNGAQAFVYEICSVAIQANKLTCSVILAYAKIFPLFVPNLNIKVVQWLQRIKSI